MLTGIVMIVLALGKLLVRQQGQMVLPQSSPLKGKPQEQQ